MSIRVLWLALLTVVLTACGGGGSGGSAGGSLSVSRTSLSFQADQFASSTPAQSVRITIDDSRAALVGAAYREGQTPADWLRIEISGSGSTFDAAFTVVAPDLAPGNYTATPSLGYADAGGNVLGYRDVRVTLAVRARLSASELPLTGALVFGDSTATVVRTVAVSADTLGWRAATSAPWIVVPAGPFTGSQPLPVTLDAGALAIGSHEGTVTLTSSSDASNTVTIPVSLSLAAPTLSHAPDSLLFGGDDGLASTPPQAFGFALDTGSNRYPWTLTLSSGPTAPAWLSGSALGGQVGGGGATTMLAANPALLTGGVYNGSARVDVDVRGTVLSYTLPVRLNREVERLQVATDGVAFSQFPSRSLLSRDIGVGTSLGRAGLPWTASSSAGWLAVTASGVTGGTLRLTVTPGVLATDTVHRATVTVTSSDPGIGSGDPSVETIEVSFWRSGSDPGRLSFAGEGLRTATNPVLPLVYSHEGGNEVSVRNIHSGELIGRFPIGTTAPGSMVVSSSGAVLYIVDASTARVLALDAVTGGALAVHPYAYFGSLYDVRLVYARTSAIPTLILGNGVAINLLSGESRATIFPGSDFYGNGGISVTGDSREIYVIDTGLSPSTISHAQVAWSTFDGARFVVGDRGSRSPGSNGLDIAVSPDGTQVYAASGAPYEFPVYTGDTLQPLRRLAGAAYPNNAETAWNGLFAGGADAYYDSTDIWFYRADGFGLGSARCTAGTSSLITGSLRFSGDAFRYVCASNGGFGGTRQLVFDNTPAP